MPSNDVEVGVRLRGDQMNVLAAVGTIRSVHADRARLMRVHKSAYVLVVQLLIGVFPVFEVIPSAVIPLSHHKSLQVLERRTVPKLCLFLAYQGCELRQL